MRLGISDKRPKPTSTLTPTSASVPPSSLPESSSELSEDFVNYLYNDGDELSAGHFELNKKESSKSNLDLPVDIYENLLGLKNEILDTSYSSEEGLRTSDMDDLPVPNFQPKNELSSVYKNYKRIYTGDTNNIFQIPDAEEDLVDSREGFYESWPLYSNDEFELPIMQSYSSSDI